MSALHAYSREQNLSMACHKKLRRCRVLRVVMHIVLLFQYHAVTLSCENIIQEREKCAQVSNSLLVYFLFIYFYFLYYFWALLLNYFEMHMHSWRYESIVTILTML